MLWRFYLLLFCLYSPTISANWVLSTQAGGGDDTGVALSFGGGAFAGDGAPATEALLNYPQSVCAMTDGRIYIADSRNHRVRMLDREGKIQTIAGTGESDYNGDNIPANTASLAQPLGVHCAADGRLFIADSNNDRIRIIDTAGIIQTLAGNGTRGYSGDNGLATAAELNAPAAIALDSLGQVYFSDRNNDVIRRIDHQGQIHTIAGGTVLDNSLGDGGLATDAQLSLPSEIVFDAADNLYIADMRNNRIRLVFAESQEIISIAGDSYIGLFQSRPDGDGGQAHQAAISLPYGLSFDKAGNLYFSSANADTIRKIAPDGIITTVAGTGRSGFSGDGAPANTAQLNSVYGLGQNISGNILIADAGNHRIRLLAPNQAPSAVFSISKNSDFAPLTLELDASASGDPEADIAEFTWYRSGWGHSSTGVQSQMQFNTAGTYAISLKVTDKAGASTIQQQLIHVRENQAPQAAFVWQSESGRLTADASASVDPEQYALTFHWQLADSFAHQGTQLQVDNLTVGDYPLTLSVVDAYGARDTLSDIIQIKAESTTSGQASNRRDLAPVAKFSAELAERAGQLRLSVDASASYDAEGQLSYVWQSAGNMLAEGIKAQFSLPVDYAHQITLTVTDSQGQQAEQTQTLAADNLCQGIAVYSLEKQTLQLPLLKIVGDASEQAYQVTLEKTPHDNYFILREITPVLNSGDNNCPAWYHLSGRLSIAQIDVALPTGFERLVAELRYQVESGYFMLESLMHK